MDTYTGTIQTISHKRTSHYGNPSYSIVFESRGTGADYTPGPKFETQTNGSVGYSITNHKPGERVTVTLSRHNRVTACESVKVSA